jgi:hypothetical protein
MRCRRWSVRRGWMALRLRLMLRGAIGMRILRLRGRGPYHSDQHRRQHCTELDSVFHDLYCFPLRLHANHIFCCV